MKLNRKDQALYDNLKKEIFELDTLNSLSLAKLADQLGIPYQKAMSWYSHMLKFYADHKRAPENNLCPTCGKAKNEVTDMAECRDVFHYL